MTHNHTYNLMMQLIQENKALWRIQHHYLKDSAGSPELEQFWKKMEQDKLKHVAELTELIKKHI